MAKRFLMTRRELEERHFPLAVVLTVPVIAIFLSVYLPKLWQPFAIVDLPLIVVIVFSISRRNPIAGTLIGAVIGLLQDLPSNSYIGVMGIAKSIVGYAASSIGPKVDVENMLTRVLSTVSLSLLQSLLLFVIYRLLLDSGNHTMSLLHELIRAAVNAAVAIPVFLLLDRTRTLL